MVQTPEAYFDTLCIVDRLENTGAKGATEEDVYLFSYLACLLFVYRRNPSSTWGYEFTATKVLAPYTIAIENSLHYCTSSGLIEGDKLLRLTTSGRTELNGLEVLERFKSRVQYLDGACTSTLALPHPTVVGGVLTTPGLRKALALASSRPLLGDGGSRELVEHFAAVQHAVGPESRDLMVPAVIWLTYLAEESLKRGEQPRAEESGSGGTA